MVQFYPALTAAEFAQASLGLQCLCEGNLEGSNWQNVVWADDELQIQQTRNGTLSASGFEHVDLEFNELERDDPEALCRARSQPSSSTTVHFSIVLSPTYQVPVLWFSFSSQVPSSATTLDRVYDVIVPPALREGIHRIGVLGGISIANHPKSDVPAFFIHPCRTQEALSTVRSSGGISPLQYLLLWFGIIGSAAGLSVPAEVVASAPISL